MYDIKEAMKTIQDSSKLDIGKRSIDIDNDVWRQYCELSKKTNLNKSCLNTIMCQFFSEELKKLLEEE